jgi:hypothetical protein
MVLSSTRLFGKIAFAYHVGDHLLLWIAQTWFKLLILYSCESTWKLQDPWPMKPRRLKRWRLLLETKDVPNGRRRDPAGRPGFRPTYGNTIFEAPDWWPLVTRLTVLILCALPPPPPGVNVKFRRGSGPLCLNLSILQVSSIQSAWTNL